jgi:hypothetical protein
MNDPSHIGLSIGVEYRGNVNGKTCQRNRDRRLAPPELPCFHIRSTVQSQHRNGFRLRINNPVLRHLRFRIVNALLKEIAFWLFRANDFQGEVGAGPETVLPAWVSRKEEQQKIGLAEFARPDS